MLKTRDFIFARLVFESFINSHFLMIDVHSCGVTTHIEISYRALYNYADKYGDLSYDTIILQNQDALEAGSTFPDAFYPTECFNGKYHNVSEDTHWTPFINTSLNYIRKQYPKPWDTNTQKLVAFIMGVLSHQVADISWHSLGIDQGFLQAMARTNYHGDFPSAHTDGDLGGDVLNLFQLDLSYSDVTGEWYLPVEDLLHIYKEYYGQEVISEDILVTCTKLSYLVRLAERIVVKKYFPISAKRSPFLVDELYSYFLGGIEDMAVWTQRIWKYFTFALENGQKQCTMDHNPLFIRCNETANLVSRKATTKALKNGYYVKPGWVTFTVADIEVQKSGRGVVFRPSKILQNKIRLTHEGKSNVKQDENHKMKPVNRIIIKENKVVLPKAVFIVDVNYAKCGSAFAVADLNGDGNEDIVIGCPGFYSPSHQESGMVFILFGTDQGLNTSVLDIYAAADVMIPGPEDPHNAHSVFGASLAVLDFDKDGKLDIVVGAPNFGSLSLTYTGRVFIYSSTDKTHYILRGTIDCQDVYCNLGTTLTTGDLNSDLYNDLIIGSQFAPGNGEQRGTVGVVHSDSTFAGKMNIQVLFSSKDFSMQGAQNYSWLGSSIAVKKFASRNETYLVIGEPNFRNCARADCTFDTADVQTVGQVHFLHVSSGSVHQVQNLSGAEQFQLFGTQLDIGRPFDQYTDVVAITAAGKGVNGHIEHIAERFDQVGTVYLYNLTNLNQDPLTVFNGDRKHGRFGAQIKFADLNRDGFDDLIIGAPLRTNDFTEELYGAQQGRVFIYYGGKNFPKGDATTNCGTLPIIEPCPAEKASLVLALEEDDARFGSHVAVVHSKNKVNLLVTAAHSSQGARLAGTISMFEF